MQVKKKIIFINMNHTRGCVHKTTKYAENWGAELRLFEEKIKRQVYKNECFTLTEHDKQHAYFP